jgi:hypothetical protein
VAAILIAPGTASPTRCYRRVTAFPERTVETLREQAARCRRLANGMTDFEVRGRLLELAVEFDERADEFEAAAVERCAD